LAATRRRERKTSPGGEGFTDLVPLKAKKTQKGDEGVCKYKKRKAGAPGWGRGGVTRAREVVRKGPKMKDRALQFFPWGKERSLRRQRGKKKIFISRVSDMQKFPFTPVFAAKRGGKGKPILTVGAGEGGR